MAKIKAESVASAVVEQKAKQAATAVPAKVVMPIPVNETVGTLSRLKGELSAAKTTFQTSTLPPREVNNFLATVKTLLDIVTVLETLSAQVASHTAAINELQVIHKKQAAVATKA